LTDSTFKRGSARGAGHTVASYLLRRNEDGTVTALHNAGEHFLTFGVDGAGRITAATTGGRATVSVHGH
jgi:YD repeat-containing protein